MQTKPAPPLSRIDQLLCPCGSGQARATCCGPYLDGTSTAPTAEALMRSRYTAFATGCFTYLQQTVAPNLREQFDPVILARETQQTKWTSLHVQKIRGGTAADTSGQVTYTAHFEQAGTPGVLSERSEFIKQNNFWLYTGGTLLTDPGLTRPESKPGRNDPCPCGSGKKYKKCCGK